MEISTKLFRTLEPKEKELWHSHADEPVGRQTHPIAKSPAMEQNSLAGEDLRLPIIRKVMGDDLRDEPQGDGAAILQG